MKRPGLFLLVFGILAAFLMVTPAGNAQTATTGTIVGTVSDRSGAFVADATVTLHNAGTNSEATQTTNSAGEYTFVNVVPGKYEITVKKIGFRTLQVPALNVDVNKSYTVNVTLELGEITQSVTVSTEAGVELQTTDAQVGNVVGGTLCAQRSDHLQPGRYHRRKSHCAIRSAKPRRYRNWRPRVCV